MNSEEKVKIVKPDKTLYTIYKYDKLDSTNAFLKQHCANLPDFSVIWADEQTHGRGRFTRIWNSEPCQDLTFSLLLPLTSLEQKLRQNITQIAALSVAQMLEGYGLKPSVKWPNDVLIQGKKISGILCEITETDENKTLMARSRFPKAMGGMMLGLSLVFFIMYRAASIYIWLLFYSSAFMDKALFFAIIFTLILFPLMGFFLLFYDKKIVVDKGLEEICIRFKFFFPIWVKKIKFAKIDEIIVENVCNSKTVAMQREAAKGTGKGIRAGYWLMSLKGKDIGKLYFDRNPKKEVILSYAENIASLTSKKVILIEN